MALCLCGAAPDGAEARWAPPVANTLCGTAVPLQFRAIYNGLNKYWFDHFKASGAPYRPPAIGVMTADRVRFMGSPIFYLSQTQTIEYNQTALDNIVAVSHEFGHHIQAIGNCYGEGPLAS